MGKTHAENPLCNRLYSLIAFQGPSGARADGFILGSSSLMTLSFAEASIEDGRFCAMNCAATGDG
jgi:hypothetical protein